MCEGLCVFPCAQVCDITRACKHKSERAYLCMHVCCSVRMPPLRVCVCALYKSVSKQGIPAVCPDLQHEN